MHDIVAVRNISEAERTTSSRECGRNSICCGKYGCAFGE